MMGNFAGQELMIVGNVNRIVTDLALNQNAPGCRERAMAALECAQIVAKLAQDAKEKTQQQFFMQNLIKIFSNKLKIPWPGTSRKEYYINPSFFK
jgi:hypothetical protein